MKSKHIGRDKESKGSEFSKLLEKNLSGISDLEAGNSYVVRVTNIKDKSYVFVSHENGQGLIDREEMQDSDGKIICAVGERIDVFYIKSENGEMHFTTKPIGDAKYRIAMQAMENKTPVKADSIKKIKGGYEVRIGELDAFCPVSQMLDDNVNPDEKLFLILEATNKRVIVSQRAYKDLQRDHQKELLQGELAIGDIVSGKIVSIQNFGVFVDLGGIEGLIPVSEIAFHRVSHPSEELKMGEEVRAKVLSLDWAEERITLSRKALLASPWQGKLPFQEGEVLEGEVESIKNFGIFVALRENFTGLIPLSESGVPRGQSPGNQFQQGQKVRVMITGIDREKERIGLSVKKVAEADSRKEYEDYIDKQNQSDESSDGVSSFGKQLMKAMKKK